MDVAKNGADLDKLVLFDLDLGRAVVLCKRRERRANWIEMHFMLLFLVYHAVSGV